MTNLFKVVSRIVYTPEGRTTLNKLKPLLKQAEQQTFNKFPVLSQVGDEFIDSIPNKKEKKQKESSSKRIYK